MRILRAAEPEGLSISENYLTERGPPGTVKSLKRPSPDRPSSVRRGAGRHPAGNHAARRMLTPPARAVPILPFKRVPASWAEQTNAPGVHTPAPGNKRRPSTDAVPRKNISLIPRNPCRKKRAELQSLRTENDALFQARILFEDKFTARRRCVPQEQAVPSPASSRKPPRRTWSGRMRPVPRLRTHMFREAVPVRHPHAVPRKDCSPLPEGGEASLPLCLPTEKTACPAHAFAFRRREGSALRPPCFSCAPRFARGEPARRTSAFSAEQTPRATTPT